MPYGCDSLRYYMIYIHLPCAARVEHPPFQIARDPLRGFHVREGRGCMRRVGISESKLQASNRDREKSFGFHRKRTLVLIRVESWGRRDSGMVGTSGTRPQEMGTPIAMRAERIVVLLPNSVDPDHNTLAHLFLQPGLKCHLPGSPSPFPLSLPPRKPEPCTVEALPKASGIGRGWISLECWCKVSKSCTSHRFLSIIVMSLRRERFISVVSTTVKVCSAATPRSRLFGN